jgi:hypothetical protein
MAKVQVKSGSTSQSFLVFAANSAATTGAGITGLLYNTSGLVGYYFRSNGASGDTTATSITLATASLGTFTSGGFKEVDATNMPGLYEVGIPNAVFNSGFRTAVVMYKGASNLAPIVIEFEMTGTDVTDSVRFGLTALPNAAAAAAGGLPTAGTGANQLSTDGSGRVNVGQWLGTAVTAATAGIPDVNTKNINNAVVSATAAQIGVNVVNWNNTVVATPATAGVPDVNAKNLGGTAQTGRDLGASVLLSAGTGTGQLDFTSGVVKANVTQIDGTVNGTHAAGMIPADVRDWLGTAVTAATAGVPDVNTKNQGGTLQTGRDLGASVLLSPGTGTGQVDLTSGQVKVQYGTAAGQISAAAGVVDTNIKTVQGTTQTARDLGLALPAAAPNAAGGLITFGSGSGQLNPSSGKVDIAGDIRIRKNIALNNFMFRMTDSTDHVSPKAGLGATITGQVSLDGAAFGALTNASAEVSAGWYKVNLAAGDVNADVVALKFTVAGADQLDISIVTQTE